MKNFKFTEPFSSFTTTGTNLREKWRTALHDPAYLICVGILILFLVTMLTSCNRKTCPAYAKNNTEQQKNI
jgi:hypothetical protein